MAHKETQMELGTSIKADLIKNDLIHSPLFCCRTGMCVSFPYPLTNTV